MFEQQRSQETSGRQGFTKPGNEYLARAVARMQHYIADRYGVQCQEVPLTGDIQATFDGQLIVTRTALAPEQQAFLTLHLFGHAVQWGLLGQAPELAAKAYDIVTNPELEKRVVDYETEASQYGAGLLATLGLEDLIPWFALMAQADRDYFLHYCRTGETRAIDDFITIPRSPLIPKTIPDFSPRKFVTVEII